MAGRGAEQEKMLTMIVEKGLKECVEYVGPIPHEELPDLFNRFDVFIFPTRRKSESLGLVGVESLACGIPVVGSNIGGIPGYVEDGVNGFLFEPGNVEDLLQKIKIFIKMDSDARLEMSRQARLSAYKYETKRVMNELYEKIRGCCK